MVVNIVRTRKPSSSFSLSSSLPLPPKQTTQFLYSLPVLIFSSSSYILFLHFHFNPELNFSRPSSHFSTTTTENHVSLVTFTARHIQLVLHLRAHHFPFFISSLPSLWNFLPPPGEVRPLDTLVFLIIASNNPPIHERKEKWPVGHSVVLWVSSDNTYYSFALRVLCLDLNIYLSLWNIIFEYITPARYLYLRSHLLFPSTIHPLSLQLLFTHCQLYHGYISAMATR